MGTLRKSVALALIIGTMTFLATSDAGATRTPPRCFGERATIVAVAGGGITLGTAGDDVIVGTGGGNTIYGNGGNDLICGGGGGDIIYAFAPDDPLSLVACVDSIDLAAYYTVKISAGSGDDLVCGPSAIAGGYWEADGGSGNDVVGNALGVDEVITGGSGSDTVNGGLHYPGNLNTSSKAYGGSGSDVVHAGESFIFGAAEPYNVLADGGSGNDTVTGAMVEGLSGLLAGGSGIDSCTVIVGFVPNALLFAPSCETQTLS